MKTIGRRVFVYVLNISGILISCTAMFVASVSAAELDLTDQLLARLLDRHTEPLLYEQANNPWPGGNYKLEVFKNGKPMVTSGVKEVRLKMPLRIAITGDAANSLLKFKLACSASFTTLGEVRLTPQEEGSVAALTSDITLPIPAVVADCDGVQLPIDNYLKALLEQNEKKWEQDLDSKINAWLADSK